jgi:photosystem II stability/assembly factor-like uncharacterized protein
MPELPAIPKTKPTVSVVHPKGKKRGLVLGISVDGDRVVAVGGQGSDLLLVSTNRGKSFKSCTSGGSGLRNVLVKGEQIWVCGEWGHVARSDDFGQTWIKAAITARGACLFGVVQDDAGAYWTAGDSGFIARSKDGFKFTKVKGIEPYIGRISSSTLGVLVPTDNPGNLYIREGKDFRKTAAKSGADLMIGRVTPRGTLLVVGGGGAILRSTDKGKTFERITVGSKGMLAGMDVVPDGRIVVVGDGGKIFVSYDDGAKFTKLAHDHTKGQLWCATRDGDSILVGGEDGLILRVS